MTLLVGQICIDLDMMMHSCTLLHGLHLGAQFGPI